MPQRKHRQVHKSSPSPYVTSRKALYNDPKEMFVSGWDHPISNDQGISRMISRMTGVDPRSTKSIAGEMPTRVYGRVAGKRQVPRGPKGTQRPR